MKRLEGSELLGVEGQGERRRGGGGGGGGRESCRNRGCNGKEEEKEKA